MIYKMATKSTSPLRILSPNKYLYLKFLGGHNFNDNLNMKALNIEQGIETQNNELKSNKEQKHMVMHSCQTRNINTW
jgi:hypothetical protein